MNGRARAALVGAVFVVGCSRPGRNSEIVRTASAPPIPVTEKHSAGCRAPLGLDVVPVGDDKSGSTVVLARTHGRLLAYVADEDTAAVRILDIDAATELASIPMHGRPSRMVMLRGGRLAVTMRDRAKVALYTPSPVGDAGLDPLCSLDTPDEPIDLAAARDGKTLFALSDWGHTLTAFDLDTGTPERAVDLPRSPRALLASADGTHVYIAHAAGGSMSSVDLRLPVPVVQAVSLAGESPTDFRTSPVAFDTFDGMSEPPDRGRNEGTPRKRTACQGFALAEVRGPSSRLFAPLVEVATGDLEVPSSGYGAGANITPELPVVAVLDESTGQPVKGSLFAHEPTETERSPCLLPRAAAASNTSLFVACMGIDAVVQYDASGGGPETPEQRRWSVPSGPTGIAIHGSRAVVWSQFAGEVTILSLANDSKPLRVPVAHVPPREDASMLALGRALFHATTDPSISGDGRACAGCHPDGRDDGLVWSTPGGPRQTPMLAGRLALTAPYGWDGAGSDVAHHLGHTFARLGGEGLPPHELEALEHYITTLEGPAIQTSRDHGQLARGRDVFFASGCGSCHQAESAWTDGQSHKVGSRVSADTIASFDTPSLHFVGGTAPYFHDGRYATLRELLASKDGPMGAARNQPPGDLDALEAFVQSL